MHKQLIIPWTRYTAIQDRDSYRYNRRITGLQEVLALFVVTSSSDLERLYRTPLQGQYLKKHNS